jgi:Regulator of Chromosome Condensation (RCC1) repeat protein/caspase domain-containing protein
MSAPDGIDFARSRAVLIGTSAYTEDLEPMPAAANSLRHMEDLLVGLCGWPSSAVTPFKYLSTGDRRLRKVSELIEEATDVLLLYYVGHGLLLPGDDLGLALTDTDTHDALRLTTTYRLGTLREQLKYHCRARLKLTILDCCFAGIATKNAQGPGGLADRVDQASRIEGTYTWTASRASQQAVYEDGDGGLTYFTKILHEVVVSGIPGKPAWLTLADVDLAVAQRFQELRLPNTPIRPEQTRLAVGGLPGMFPFAPNAAPASVSPEAFRSASMVAGKLGALASAAPGTTAGTPTPAVPAGTVVAWGGNQFGACEVPDGLTDVVAVAAGECHSLALTSEGTVVAWGDNSAGQCRVPPWLTGVTAIAAGGGLSFALTSAGTVAAWGDRRSRQCDVPDGLTGVSAIAAGFNYGLAVSDGKVVGWGVEVPAMRDIPPGLTGVAAVAASAAHSLALTREETIVTWGTAPSAKEPLDDAKLPARLLSWVNKKLASDLFQVPSGLTQVVAVAAGSTYSMALNSDGTVVGWGRFFSTSPFRVPSGPSYSVPQDLPMINAIASGANHSLAVTSRGTVEAGGHNRSGQCTVPDGLTEVIAIAAGHNHCLAVTSQTTDA